MQKPDAQRSDSLVLLLVIVFGLGLTSNMDAPFWQEMLAAVVIGLIATPLALLVIRWYDRRRSAP